MLQCDFIFSPVIKTFQEDGQRIPLDAAIEARSWINTQKKAPTQEQTGARKDIRI